MCAIRMVQALDINIALERVKSDFEHAVVEPVWIPWLVVFCCHKCGKEVE